MIRVVISTSEATSTETYAQQWATVYEDGIERGRLGLSHEGTDELTSALRNASIEVTDLTAVPEEDDGSTDV